MSDGGKKSRSRATDVQESKADGSQYGEYRSWRGSGRSGDVDSKKDYREDEYFDSGIQSECCLSSDAISETDLKYGDSALDCGYDSKSLDREEEEGRSSEGSSREAPKEEYESRTLDSGVILEEEPLESPTAELAETKSVGAAKVPQSRSSLEALLERDDEGNTKLHLAIIQGREVEAMSMLSRIPESRYLDLQNHRRETCLHLSVLVELPFITHKLVLAGARTGIEDSNGNTPLHLACKINSLECVDALLNRRMISHGMNFNNLMYNPKIDYPHTYIDEWNYDGLTCTHLAAVHPDFKVLYQLFLNGCDVNKRECKGGYTILHAAVRCGRVDLVEFILLYKNLNKVNTEIQNYARLTPYQLSAYYPQIANILAANGARQLRSVDESDEDSSDESSDDEFDNSGIGSPSQMINNLVINSVIPPVITTAS